MPVVETREHIIQTAIMLFGSHGYENVPLLEIAFDAGMDEEHLKTFFPTKLDLYSAIYQYIPELLLHYDPTREDILELLQMGETPEEILGRFVTYYDLKTEKLLRCLYRFAFMEQMKSRENGEAVNQLVVRQPAENAARAIEVLIEQGEVPPCDARTLTDMWNRTSLMHERLTTLQEHLIDYEAYYEMTQFFIGLAVNGFTPLNTDGLTLAAPENLPLEQSLPIGEERLEILRPALALFDEKGYVAVSMPEIARVADIPLGRLYGLYPNKSDILGEVMRLIGSRREYGPNKVFSQALAMEDGRQAVMHLAGAYSAMRDDLTRNLYRVLFREKYFSEDLRDYIVGSLFRDIDAITQTLDKLSAEGAIAPCESRKIATAFAFSMCSFSIGETVFDGDYQGSVQARLRVIGLILGLIKRY